VIDAHAHVWDARLFPMAWLWRHPRLRERYTLADLRSDAGDALPDRVVLVQAGTSAGGTAWLLRSVADESLVGAVVASCRLGVDEGRTELERRIGDARSADTGDRLRGFRVSGLGQGEDFFARPAVQAGLAVLADHGLSAHLLAEPDQLLGVATAMSRVPHASVVLDHLGSPPSARSRAGWRRGLAAVARSPRATAKLSGAALRVDDGSGDAEAVAAWALTCFGPDRLMFGSDWPASTPMSYGRVVRRTRQLLAGAGADPRAAPVWAGTAGRTLGIEGGGTAVVDRHRGSSTRGGEP